MTRILVLQHSPYEPLGIIIHTLKRMKLRIRYINFSRDPHQRVNISHYHGIVILGGAMHPNQLDRYPHLVHEIELLQMAIAKEVPVLGVCLGSQLLNIALGGTCYSLGKPELGWVEVEKRSEHQLLDVFTEPMHVFQWHQFANHPPPGADILLENCRCVQAFSFKSHMFGLQFHLEVDASLIQRWLEHPDYLEHLHRHLLPEDIQTIRKQSKFYLPNSMAIARLFFANFFLLFNKKTYALSSNKAGGELY